MPRPCTSCSRLLPEHCFPMAGGKRRGSCWLCTNDGNRLRTPLAPIQVDREQVKLNNATSIWHGWVDRGTPLRNVA